MRRGLTVAAVIALLAAGVTAFGAGIPNEWSGPDNAKPRIDFSAHYHHGAVIQLRRFSWDQIPCRGHGYLVDMQFAHAIVVRHHRFSHAERIPLEKGLDVKVTGHFDAHWTKASGYIELATGSPSCVSGSGRIHWVATPK